MNNVARKSVPEFIHSIYLASRELSSKASQGEEGTMTQSGRMSNDPKQLVGTNICKKF